MDYEFLEPGIALRVADSWVARAAGSRVVVAHPKELMGTPPEQLPVSVFTQGASVLDQAPPARDRRGAPKVRLVPSSDGVRREGP